MPSLTRTIRRFSAVAALCVLATACDDDPTGGGEQEPEIASARVTLGAQSVTISDNGTQTGTLTLPRGASTVSVQWLRADGSNETLVTSDEFEVRMPAAAGTTGITFAPSGAFGGTFTTTTAGSKVVGLQLFHLEEQHEDFGPLNVTLTAQ